MIFLFLTTCLKCTRALVHWHWPSPQTVEKKNNNNNDQYCAIETRMVKCF